MLHWLLLMGTPKQLVISKVERGKCIFLCFEKPILWTTCDGSICGNPLQPVHAVRAHRHVLMFYMFLLLPFSLCKASVW